MTSENEHEQTYETRLPAWITLALILVAFVALGGLGLAWSASNSANDIRTASTNDMQAMKVTYDKTFDSVQARLEQTEKTNTVVHPAKTGHLS
jgi:nitrate/nitrite-specific signal transduction histidine kinase